MVFSIIFKIHKLFSLKFLKRVTNMKLFIFFWASCFNNDLMTHPYLSFTDSTYASPGKVVGTSDRKTLGNGLSNKSVTIVEIPYFFDNVKVIEIGQYAFTFSSITSVFIPKTVQLIGYSAFYDCQKLTDVIFEPGSELIKVSAAAFQLDNSLINIDFPPSLKEIGATGMGDSVFRQVTSLKCFSYLGSTNFESGNFFNNEPVVHVSNANYPEGKNFAYKKPLRDDKTCRKSNPLPNAQKNKCKYSIIACNHHPNLLCAMVFLLAS